MSARRGAKKAKENDEERPKKVAKEIKTVKETVVKKTSKEGKQKTIEKRTVKVAKAKSPRVVKIAARETKSMVVPAKKSKTGGKRKTVEKQATKNSRVKKSKLRYTEGMEAADVSDDSLDDAAINFVADADADIENVKPTDSQPSVKRSKKRGKEAKVPQENEEDGRSSVIYIGHIPHGFYEDQMRQYFSQYGDVLKVKLSRSKKTGRSKGFGFVEFESPTVAKIAAESMNGYLMFGQILEVEVVDEKKVHPELFKGTERKFRTVPWRIIDKNRRNRSRSAQETGKLRRKLLAKEKQKRESLKNLGIDYNFPGYEAAKSSA